MTTALRLSPVEDETSARPAISSRMGEDQAAAALDLATPRSNHPEFVRESTARLLDRYRTLLARFAGA